MRMRIHLYLCHPMTREGDKKQCRRHLTNQYAEKVSAQQNVGVASTVLEGKDESVAFI